MPVVINIIGIDKIIKTVIVLEPINPIENKVITIPDKNPKIINEMPCFICFVRILFDAPFCFLFRITPIINPAIEPYIVNGTKLSKKGNINGKLNRFKIEIRVHLEVNDIPRQSGNINRIKKYLIMSIESPINKPFCHGLKLDNQFFIENLII